MRKQRRNGDGQATVHDLIDLEEIIMAQGAEIEALRAKADVCGDALRLIHGELAALRERLEIR